MGSVLGDIAQAIGVLAVLACVLCIGLFAIAGKHGQERRSPIGDGEADEPRVKNGTDEKERQ